MTDTNVFNLRRASPAHVKIWERIAFGALSSDWDDEDVKRNAEAGPRLSMLFGDEESGADQWGETTGDADLFADLINEWSWPERNSRRIWLLRQKYEVGRPLSHAEARELRELENELEGRISREHRPLQEKLDAEIALLEQKAGAR